jgi:hypothetical protein
MNIYQITTIDWTVNGKHVDYIYIGKARPDFIAARAIVEGIIGNAGDFDVFEVINLID